MKKIAFNASMMSRKPTGVGVYTIRLLDKIRQRKALSFNIYGQNIGEGRMSSLRRFLWNLFILPWVVRKSDLIYSFSTHGSPFIKKQIITIHDLICLNFPEQHRLQYCYFKYVVPIIIRSCIKIVAISEFTKSEIMKYYNVESDKIVVIKNGASFAKYEENLLVRQQTIELTGGMPYFLCVGASYGHKNIHRLLEAIKLTKSNCLFIIVGKNNKYFDTVRKKVTNEHMSNVLLLDYVSEDLLSCLYKNAVCNIYVSLYEGFGFPPLEAASFNTVSIVSSIPSLKEIYKDSVIYVDPFSAESMANKITMVAEGHIDLMQYKSKLYSILSTYCWNNTSSEIINLINKSTKPVSSASNQLSAFKF